MLRWIVRIATHGSFFVCGFALGVYLLPILTAPPSIDRAMLTKNAEAAQFKATLSRDLKGSDFLHWGEGTISITPNKVVHQGKLAPGPDYKLYLVPSFVDDEESFLAVKERSLQVGEVKVFDGFIVDLPPATDLSKFNTVLVWCEAFGEFITAAKFR